MINVEALAMRDEIAKELFVHALKISTDVTEREIKYCAETSLATADAFMRAKYASDKGLIQQAAPKPQNERNPIGDGG